MAALLTDDSVENILDLMDGERGPSSDKQDASARSKFNRFLTRHIDPNLSLNSLTSTNVTKKLVGKFLSFLVNDTSVHWQTSMNYLSSVKRQLEEHTGTSLFSDVEWYKRCRKLLHKSYVMQSIQTGKKLREQAPLMTMEDLDTIGKILYTKNDPKALMDRTLLNKQWVAIGRSSDVGNISFSDLNWLGNCILIDMTRYDILLYILYIELPKV